jgi:glycosyltransferase involved in cell wall biosynthesis
MRQKILILTPFFPPNIGGAETFAENLVNELSKKYETKVCTINWGRQKLFIGTGIKQFLDVFPHLLPKFIYQLMKNKFDIVYAQGFNSALMAALFKRICGYKLFIIILALYDFKDKNRLFKYIAKKILNSADKIFVEGDVVKQEYLALNIAENKIFKYQHWCQEAFKPVERNHKELIVLCAGRLDMAEKGISIIKEVEWQLRGKEIKFVYAKNVPHEFMPNYFQMADVVVIPSIYSESFPLVAFESASCGCAIITSNRGSLPELISSFGVIVEPTVRNFIEWIEKFYYDRELLLQYQKKAFEYAKEHFSPKNAEIFMQE